MRIFLEYASNDAIDPDAALKAFEDLSATLLSADPPVQRLICVEKSQIAAMYDSDESSFVELFADRIGLFEGD